MHLLVVENKELLNNKTFILPFHIVPSDKYGVLVDVLMAILS